MDDLLIHYGGGLFVTLNPCVLPILPFVILSALNVNRFGPIALSAGLLTAYGLVGGTLAVVFGTTVERVSEGLVSQISTLLLLAMGMLFLVPRFYTAFTDFLGRFLLGAQQAASDVQGVTLREQFVIGFLLALAWVPCSMPAIIAAGPSATTGNLSLWFTYLRYTFLGLGAITFILILGFGAHSALIVRRIAIASWVNRLKPVLGTLLVITGLLIFTGGVAWIETQLNGTWSRAVEGLGGWLENLQYAGQGSLELDVPQVKFRRDQGPSGLE